jgi:hypothetical protein
MLLKTTLELFHAGFCPLVDVSYEDLESVAILQVTSLLVDQVNRPVLSMRLWVDPLEAFRHGDSSCIFPSDSLLSRHCFRTSLR